MSKYTLDVNNYCQGDVESALSLYSLDVEFDNVHDQRIYTILSNNIEVYVRDHIILIKNKYEDELQNLAQEQGVLTTSDERKSEITYIMRCIEYGKKFEKNRRYIYKYNDQLRRILVRLFQSYRLNKMIWINRDKTFYNKTELIRYFSYIFNCPLMCLTFDVLEELGYIDSIGYTKATRYSNGKSSRYMPSGICQIFDRITGMVHFIAGECKEVVILKDDITKTVKVKTKLGGYIYVEKTTKKLKSYKDTDFTNGRRNFINKINNFYDSKKIEVAARCILLKKSFIPILYHWTTSNRINIKRLIIEECKNNEHYITYINKLMDEGYNVKMCNGCLVDEVVDYQCMYKYILSQEIAINKDSNYNNIYKDYIFVKEIEFEILDKSIRSVFNRGSFERGGRFYSAIWTELPKTLRKAILIDGSQVKSGDYKAHHIRLAYHVDGVECPFDDPYDIAGTSREEMKLASLVSINAPDLDSAVFATAKKINSELSKNISEDNAECLLMKFVDKHPVLIDKVASDYGVTLQFYDSEIMRDALEALMDLGICGLGVHDEIIVPAKDIDKAVEIMIEAYQQQPFTHGFKPTVTVDKTEISLFPLFPESDFEEAFVSDEIGTKKAA